MNTSPKKVIYEVLIEPWKINLLDPAVLYTTVYVALIYAIFYSFLASFPLVYPGIYPFSLGQSSLPFLLVLACLFIVSPLYCAYYYFIGEPRIRREGIGPPENRLIPGMVSCFMIPFGLFMFAWATRPTVHWIASVIAVGMNNSGTYLVIQCVFMHMPSRYPDHASSLFAANVFARSSPTCGALLFSRPTFESTGIAAGISLLGGCTIVCTVGLFVLHAYGPHLRARSRFVVK